MDLENKVALITGGANGIGLATVKELLRNGIKHVAVLDVDISVGEESAEELNAEFGEGRVIFIPCDVTNDKQFEAGFATVIERFHELDIVINNAGVFDEGRWELMININFAAVVRGTLLGFRHMGKDRGGKGGVIVNVSSILGLDPVASCAIYDGTKHAVVGLSRSFALPRHYDKTGIRVLTVCPGMVETKLITELNDRQFLDFLNAEEAIAEIKQFPTQKVELVAEGMVHVIKSAKSGTVWVAEGGEPIYELLIPNRFDMKVPPKI